MDDPAANGPEGRDERLLGAVNAALDDLLGPEPTDLVEEQAETTDPSVGDQAMAHLYRSSVRLHGFG